MLQPIFEAATACRQKFDRLRDSERYDRDVDFAVWLQRRYIDFNLWSHSSGSLAEGRYSLDEKLHLRESLQSTLSNLLWILDSLLANKDQFLHPGQNLARRDVEDTLSDVVTLTATARNALPCSSIWTMDDANINSSLRKELDDFKEEMSQTRGASADDGQTSTEEPTQALRNRRDHSTAHVMSQQIRDRLIDANVKRRARFVLARTKWEKTKQPKVADIATTWPPRSAFMLPAPPVVSASSTNFGCPYCYDSLPAYFAEAHAWREHITADLAPYTCLIPGCPQPLSFYATRKKWLDHMLNDPHGVTKSQEHIQYWPCPLCEEKFHDNESRIKHLEDKHIAELKKLGVSASSSVQLDPAPIINMDAFTTCPVCPLVGGSQEHYKCKRSTKIQENGADDKKFNEEAWRDFVDHVAWCLEAFSMKTMESPVNDNPVLPGTFPRQTVTELDASPSVVTVKPPPTQSVLGNILASAPSRWLKPFRKARPQSIRESSDPLLLNNTDAAVSSSVPHMRKHPSSMITEYHPSSFSGSGDISLSASAAILNSSPAQKASIAFYLKAYTSYEGLVSGSSVPQWHMRNALEAIRGVMSIPVN
ncbi:cyclopropane-fatty-acyl-phospholipid synthase [Ilyonectria robusta]